METAKGKEVGMGGDGMEMSQSAPVPSLSSPGPPKKRRVQTLPQFSDCGDLRGAKRHLRHFAVHPVMYVMYIHTCIRSVYKGAIMEDDLASDIVRLPRSAQRHKHDHYSQNIIITVLSHITYPWQGCYQLHPTPFLVLTLIARFLNNL